MMNILGFIAAILIIFSITSSFMFKQHEDINNLKKSIKGYYNAHNQSQNAYEQFLYDSIYKEKKTKEKLFGSINLKPQIKKIKNLSNQNNLDKNIDEENNNKIADSKELYECCYIDIFPLLKNGKVSEKQTYELFARLIRTVHFSSLPKNCEYTLINNLIQAYQTADDENISLEKLSLSNTNLQKKWYSLLRGTKFYNFEKKEGCPSLLDFITLNKKKPTKICAMKAPIEIFSALFNEKIAIKIINHRKENKKITQQDIEKIIREENYFIKNDFDAWSLIEYSHSKHDSKAHTVVCKDIDTEVSIRRNLRVQ